MARIAVVQMMASTEKEANLQHVLSCISKAARDGAALVAFPEYMMFYTPSSQTPDQLAALSEEPAGPFVSAVASAAGRHGIEVVGTFYERRRGRGRGRGRGKVYDTSFHIDAGGRLASLYRKIHLYDALGFRESDKMAPGRSIAAPARSPAVGSLGMMVCYDLRFPEMSRTLAQAGSDVIVAPSAWVRGRLKEAEMRTHPDKNRLYEALGGDRQPKAEAGGKELNAGDGFLLLSDGVWENVTDADLEATIREEDLRAALIDLVARAKAHGGPECDNLSAAAARCREAPPRENGPSAGRRHRGPTA